MKKYYIGLMITSLLAGCAVGTGQQDIGSAAADTHTSTQVGLSKNEKASEKSTLNIMFADSEQRNFDEKEQVAIHQILINSDNKVRELLPSLTQDISVNIKMVDRDLNAVGGVTGRADTPNMVIIEISNSFPGGITNAIDTALASTVFHEFHHLVRGWTMQENKFGPGIPIAAVNEGLATVFSEKYAGKVSNWTDYPANVEQWVLEILELPSNAPYSHWMMDVLPDGRSNIGYRTGRFIIHQALANSGKSVIELTDISPHEILELSGLIDNHAPSLAKLGDHFATNNSTDKAIVNYQKAYELAKIKDNTQASVYLNKIELLNNPVVISEAVLASYAGRYESEKFKFEITKQGGQLIGTMPGRPAFKLIAEDQNTFTIRVAPVKFEFQKDSTSQIVKLVFHANNSAFEVAKVN